DVVGSTLVFHWNSRCASGTIAPGSRMLPGAARSGLARDRDVMVMSGAHHAAAWPRARFWRAAVRENYSLLPGERSLLPSPGTPADAILDRIVHYIRTEGPVNTSLRQLAEVAGTSHRMLKYYFGSRENLLGAVMVRLRKEDYRRVESSATRVEFLTRM